MQRSQQLDAEKAKAAAEDIAKKAAKKAQVAAEKERENKRICLEYERMEHAKQRGAVTSITTPPKGKKTSNYVSGKPLLQKGDTVRVSSDYSPYKNSPGGDGIVTDVKGSGGKLTVDVQHDAIAAQKFEMKKNGGMNLCRGWRADSMGLSRDDPDFDTAIAVDYGAVASAAAMRKTLGMATLPATKDPLAIVNLAHAYGVERHHPKDAYDRLMMPQKADRAKSRGEEGKQEAKEKGKRGGARSEEGQISFCDRRL